MAELPRVVWHRLRRTSIAAGPPGGVGASAGGPKSPEHPDANLLSAFIEQSLTKQERELVVNHLAGCEVCREQVVMALPAQADKPAVFDSLSPGRRAAWRFWRVVRWSALGATLGLIGVIVVLHRSEFKTPLQSSSSLDKYQRRPVEARPSEESNAASSARGGTVGGKVNAPSPASGAGEVTARDVAPAGQAVPKTRTSAAKDEPARENALMERQATEEQAESSVKPAVAARLAQKKEETRAEAKDIVISPPSPAFGARTTTDRLRAHSGAAGSNATEAAKSNVPAEDLNKTLAGGIAGAPAAPSSQIAQLPSQEADRGQAAKSKAAAATGPAGKTYDSELRTPRAAMPTSPPPRAAQSEAITRTDEGFRLAQAGAANLRWTVTPSGKVERSPDGMTWEPVIVDKNVRFRAIYAAGSEVWAGGLGGALYHSSDNGLNWTRIPLTPGKSKTTVEITSIDFIDPLHGRVMTSTGAAWITADGGSTWSGQQGPPSPR